jgi:hypothetical protein
MVRATADNRSGQAVFLPLLTPWPAKVRKCQAADSLQTQRHKETALMRLANTRRKQAVCRSLLNL